MCLSPEEFKKRTCCKTGRQKTTKARDHENKAKTILVVSVTQYTINYKKGQLPNYTCNIIWEDIGKWVNQAKYLRLVLEDLPYSHREGLTQTQGANKVKHSENKEYESIKSF